MAVRCGDRSGFIVNALLFPYLNDAVKMVRGPLPTADEIDTAMKEGCALPMGPFELLDVAGNDVSLGDPARALPGVPRSSASRPPRCWSTSSPPATLAARPAVASATTAERRQSRQNSLPSGSVITMKPALIGGVGS